MRMKTRLGEQSTKTLITCKLAAQLKVWACKTTVRLCLLAALALALVAVPLGKWAKQAPKMGQESAHRLVPPQSSFGWWSGGDSLHRLDGQLKPLPLSARPHRHKPRIPFDDSLRDQGLVSSLNWSGYAVTGSAGSVTAVSGTWTVPMVTGPSGDYSAMWVGLDGFNDSTVEQIGTAQDTAGTPYYAWYEIYPAAPVVIPNSVVKPGDTIEASVSYLGNNTYLLTMTDVTENWTFSTNKLSSAQRSSAEWIMEAPSSIRGVLPLADFGTAYFTGECLATINGSTAPIGGFPTDVAITMVTRGGQVKALPSALLTDADPLGSDGSLDEFYVTWKHQ